MYQRIPLMSGDNLQIRLDNGGSIDFSIIEAIGYGGSCIVYRGQCISNNTHRTQIIKEFYPANICSIKRIGNVLEVPNEDFSYFSQRKENFCNAAAVHSLYFESNSNYATPRPFLIGEANNTVYIISDPSQGTILSDITPADLNLHKISKIMFSICSAIQNFHDHGLLYLDCKPDNISFYEVDRQYHIRLFDFDTIAKIRDIKDGKCIYATYSNDWAPGEQRHWHTKEIGPETDIYSVGAVFFYLLTGMKPTDNDIAKIGKNRFSWRFRSSVLENASDKSLAISQKILVNSLQSVPSSRYRDISRPKEEFSNLAAITKGTPSEDGPLYDALKNIEQTLASLKKSDLNNITDNISSPELKEALLSEQAKLSTYKAKYAAASKEYQANPTAISRQTLDITERAFNQQQEKLVRLRKDIIENLTIIMEHHGQDDLDHREEMALEAVGCGNYTQANCILRDPNWKNDIQSLHTIIADMKVKCQQYISGQKLLISNLRATGIDENVKKEIVEIYQDILRLCENHQVEYFTLYDYAEFCLLERDYQQGIFWGERLLQHFALQNTPSETDIAKLNVLLGELYFREFNYQKSFDYYNQATAIYKNNLSKYGMELIRLYNDIADLYWRQNDYLALDDTLSNALSYLEPLSHSEDDSYLKALSQIYNRMAVSKNKRWYLDEAEAYHLNALHLRRSLLKKNPNDDEIILDISTSLSNLGIVYRRMKRYEEAEKCQKEAYTLRMSGYSRNKTKFGNALALVCSNYAYLLSEIGHTGESERLIELALTIRRALADKSPNVYSRAYAISLDDYGEMLTRFDDEAKLKQAESVFNQAIDIKSTLAGTDYATHSYSLATSYAHYGNLLKKTGKILAADSYYRKALPIFSELESKNPGCYEHDLATTFFELADLIRCNNGPLEDAQSMYQQALHYGEKVMQNCPKYYRLDYIKIIKGLINTIRLSTNESTEIDSLTTLLAQLEIDE